MHPDHVWWPMHSMWKFPFFTIIIVVAIAFWIGHRTAQNTSKPNPTNQNHGIINTRSAIDILNERYAKGEIGKDEFEQIKRDITDQS